MTHAALFRAGYKTCNTWREGIELITEAFNSYATFFAYGLDGFRPSHWLGNPLACNLRDAQEGINLHPDVCVALQRTRCELALSKSLKMKETKLSTQALAAAHLDAYLLVDNLDSLIVKRLSTLFPQHAVEFEFADLAVLTKMLKTLKPFYAFAAVKTYLNAWTTSARYHDGVANKCIFKCCATPRSDCISHYFKCPALWNEIDNAFQRPLAQKWDHDVVDRLAFDSFEPHKLVEIAIAFQVYHAAKASLRVGGPSRKLSELVASATKLALESHPRIFRSAFPRTFSDFDPAVCRLPIDH